ncbi:hypothetical protein [Sphingopyxis sp.]|uniref:hypothetical protein n=1 Tax=Sphingopyxis sp. TaxID=1908224 RepID=UPI003459E96C
MIAPRRRPFFHSGSETMASSKAARRPPVHMIDSEAECLSNLALAVEDRLPDVAELLLGEISRAVLHKAARMPPGTVTMHSHVTFTDEASDREYRYQLVFPKDAMLQRTGFRSSHLSAPD